MSSNDEADLLARCRRGESKAWGDLFDRYYPSTARFVFQLSHQFSREDTEEICQEIFLSVIRNIGAFKGDSRFQTWLFRIAANKAHDHHARQLAAKRGGGKITVSMNATDAQTGLAMDPPDPAPSPDASLMASERAAAVMEALAHLGDPCREIIELRYFADLSYEEISGSLRLNLKTVSSRLSKCLDKLEEIVRNPFSGKEDGLFSV